MAADPVAQGVDLPILTIKLRPDGQSELRITALEPVTPAILERFRIAFRYCFDHSFGVLNFTIPGISLAPAERPAPQPEPTADVTALRRLISQGSPGPWEPDTVETDGSYGSGEDVTEGFDAYQMHGPDGLGKHVVLFSSEYSTATVVEEETWSDEDGDGVSAWDKVAKANFELIAAMRNQLPALLDELERLRAERPAPAVGGDVQAARDRALEDAAKICDASAENGWGEGEHYATAAASSIRELISHSVPAVGGEAVLPCDVEIGNVHFAAGVKLSIFFDAARRWYESAKVAKQREFPDVDRQPRPVADLLATPPAAPAAVPEGWRLLPGVGQCTVDMLHAMSRVDGYDHDRDMPGLQRWGDYWDAAVQEAPAHSSPPIGHQGRTLCAAVRGNTGANDPQECDWPVCGCDPAANKVIEALEESAALATPPAASQDDPVNETAVRAALGATTEELPESVQYVLLRGLSAMGWALPADGTHDVMEAALRAALSVVPAASQGADVPDGSELARLTAENADLRISVVGFGALWMVPYAKAHGLPDGHLFAEHYDILARAGARMDDFTRAPAPRDGREGER